MHSDFRTSSWTARHRACSALLLMLALFGLSASTLAQTATPDARLARAGALRAAHKPADVPDDYIQTPFGYFAPACVRQVHRNERVLGDGGLQRANGVREQAQACTQDNFTPSGIRVRPDGRSLDGQQIRGNAALAASSARRTVPPPITHDWVQSAIDVTGNKMGRIVASWTVPQNPTNVAHQTVYFFPGMQSDDPTILQPVLGYRGDSNTWDLSSWNCCQDGMVWYSDFIPAKAGDRIVGDTYATCNNGSPCANWNVDTRNVTTGQSVRLSTTYDINSRTHLVVGGALEVYAVDSCDQYPPDRRITFDAIGVYDYRMQQVASPAWVSYSDSSGLDVQCDYAVDTTATSATISY
ncbi:MULTISPECIES: hypothetical protein [Xanthomonas]|uniref:hypothetical protein n=1 Tax=Xanthomonas TaxID=338 RepID=UPI001ADB45CD|nr:MULTISPECIES: hypothetical protein [unclassified Xanthomonas]MBO9873924.1 hypothetical protein [Xanthomonas sp. D-93]WNH43860.1 hypothetical protein PG878_15235 [Xanthomonas sp. A6251]